MAKEKINISATIDPIVNNKIHSLANGQHRNFSNFVEYVLIKHIDSINSSRGNLKFGDKISINWIDGTEPTNAKFISYCEDSNLSEVVKDGESKLMTIMTDLIEKK